VAPVRARTARSDFGEYSFTSAVSIKAETPVIEGTLAVGGTLTVQGDWSPKNTELTYNWNRIGAPTPIQSGPSSSYVLTDKDKNRRIYVEVTGSMGCRPCRGSRSSRGCPRRGGPRPWPG